MIEIGENTQEDIVIGGGGKSPIDMGVPKGAAVWGNIFGSIKDQKDLIAALEKYGFKQKTVPSLASVTNPDATTMYFVPSAKARTNNVYDEFIWVITNTPNDGDGQWEQVGSTPDHEVDTTSLSGKVIIIKDGVQYAVTAEKIEKPAVPTVTAGANFYNSMNIVINAVAGATLRYNLTTDGTEPANPTKDSGTAVNSNTKTIAIGSTSAYQTTYKIKVVAIKNGQVSDVSTMQTYVCTRKLTAPSISVGGTKYDSSRTVTLTQASADSIKYRIGTSGDYSTYNSSSKPAITTNGATLYAYATKSGWADSDVSNSGAVTIGANMCYIGQAASLSTESDIKALSVGGSVNSYKQDTLVVSGDIKTVNLGSTTEYVWFAIPNTAARNLTVKSEGFGVTLQSAAGTIIGSYRVWRTANKINSTFKFEFS